LRRPQQSGRIGRVASLEHEGRGRQRRRGLAGDVGPRALRRDPVHAPRGVHVLGPRSQHRWSWYGSTTCTYTASGAAVAALSRQSNPHRTAALACSRWRGVPWPNSTTLHDLEGGGGGTHRGHNQLIKASECHSMDVHAVT
jgi:hypothetical protein